MNDKKVPEGNAITAARPARRALRNSAVVGLAIAPLLVMGIGPAGAAEPTSKPAKASDPKSAEPALLGKLDVTSPQVAGNPGALLASGLRDKPVVIRDLKASKQDVAVRNKETYAKAHPMWVQPPVLVRTGKRYAFMASVSARTHRVTRKGPDLRAKSKTDRLDLDIKVARKTALGKGKPVSLLAKRDHALRAIIRKSPARHGVVSFTVPVSKALGKELTRLSAAQLRKRTAVMLHHQKDTFSDVPGYEYQMVVPGLVTKKRLSKKAIRSAKARNARSAKQAESGLKTRSLSQPDIGSLDFQNNTPFIQTVNFVPDAACMSTPSTITVGANFQIGPISAVLGTGTYFFDYSVLSGVYSGNWHGVGPEVSSDGQPAVSAGQVGQAALESYGDLGNEDPELFSAVGVGVGAVAATLGFIGKIIKDANDSPNTCDNFGQFWHATSTAVGMPMSNNNPVLSGTPQDWATATYAVQQPNNTTVTYQDQVTSAANSPAAMPTGQQLANLQGTVLSAVGMTTQATYFHNAGMPGPMAGVPNHPNWAGTMSWSQGMTQTIFPNPFSCPSGGCQVASSAVQLLYIANGAEDPFGPTLDQLPTVTATTSPDEQDPTKKQLDLQCNIGAGGSWISPYGGTSTSPTNTNATQLSSLVPGQQNVQAAQYAVAYYAQDAAGNYLYSPSSVGPNGANYPGTATNGTTGLPALGPNAGQQIINMNSNQPSAASMSISDINSLVDVKGNSQVPVSWGCAVTPVVGWNNMPINGTSPTPQNGNNWPFPSTATGASGPLGTNPYNDPNPINAINLSWAGSTYFSVPLPLSTVTVSSISPASGPVTGNTNVTIKGKGFQSGATVTIGAAPNAQPCTRVVLVNSQTLTCVTGATPDASNSGDVTVTNPQEGSNVGQGLFAYAPVVSSVSPATGPIAGGTPITIRGTGFINGTVVEVGGVSCAGPVVHSTTITCTTGQVRASGASDVVVTTPEPFSEATLRSAFTFSP